MKLLYSRKISVLLILLLAGTVSCKKFLATYSQNSSFVENAKDLNEILIGDGYYDRDRNIHTYLHFILDDDMQLGVPSGNAIAYLPTGFHYWQPEARMNILGQVDETDINYNTCYSKIARLNTILAEVNKLRLKGEPSELLNKIAGEAKFLRAFYYFSLVNFYGKPYKAATAEVDMGVPLKINPEIEGQFAERSSVKKVYDQMIVDLKEAAELLHGVTQPNTLRASQAAAFGLLSRIYLYMEEYELAVDYADKVINTGAFTLTDLNTHVEGTEFITRNSPEVVFTMGGNYINAYMGINNDQPASFYTVYSNELVFSYAAADLRKRWFKSNSKGEYRNAKKIGVNANAEDVSDRFLIRLHEMYLNKAEALACMERFDEARTIFIDLWKYRFKPADMPQVAETGAALVNLIREERRREFITEGQRWFDLRRYGVNSKYPFTKTITHRSVARTISGYSIDGYYELGPYHEDEAGYTVPIANDEIEFNQGRIVNEFRKERPLKQ